MKWEITNKLYGEREYVWEYCDKNEEAGMFYDENYTENNENE